MVEFVSLWLGPVWTSRWLWCTSLSMMALVSLSS